MSFLYLSLLILLSYLGLILAFYYGFKRVHEFQLTDTIAQHKFSILVPFRNESLRIPGLLESLKKLHYPTSHYEVIFINDDSSDDSELVISKLMRKKPQIQYRIIQNQRHSSSPKKDAIELGVTQAQHPYIITTDADVVLPKYWLESFDDKLKQCSATLIAAPVKLAPVDRFLDRYQALDVLSLQGTSIGAFGLNSPLMCNGANLCYLASEFKRLKAYETNSHIASGDDIFLLQAFTKHTPDKIAYLKTKQAMVTTPPETSWTQVLEQRQRWASKSSHYQSRFAQLVGIIVLFMNVLIVALPFAVVLEHLSLKSASMIFMVKFSIDFLLLFKTCQFFEEEELLLSYFISSLLHPFATIVVVFKSLFSGYTWKGRQHKK